MVYALSMPANPTPLDNVNSTSQAGSEVPTNSSSGGQVVGSLQQNTPSPSQSGTSTYTISPYATQLNNNGIQFTSQPNPLNVYANYTYHIRFSILSLGSAYNQDGTYATMNGSSRIVITESGVTAGFNITEFEYKNTCAPTDKNMNTTSTTWSMTITEPYGMSLIDKMFTAGNMLGIPNWNRAPYFIEIWFNGYNADGTLMSPTLFYTQYRVLMFDIDIKTTEGGSVYSLSGAFDGNLGHSNEISIPPAKFQLSANNLGMFFDTLQTSLNTEITANVNNNKQTITTYNFVIPNAIRSWPFKASQLDSASQRVIEMNSNAVTGSTSFSISKGVSMENVINAVISTCPNVSSWIQSDAINSTGSPLLSQKGLATWPMIHCSVQITGFDDDTRDYFRTVTYNLIPYSTIIGISDRTSVENLMSQSVQQSKLNYLINSNNLVKEYDYIFTGLNTEVINFDISIDSAWQISIPQWSALNTYYNFVQGPIFDKDGPGDSFAQGTFNSSKGNSSTPTNVTGLDSGIGTVYLEDVQSSSISFPYPIVIRQKNKPVGVNANTGSGDAPKAVGKPVSDGKTFPQSRELTGSFLANLFGNASSFLNIELQIRGDPYWMGSGNVIEDTYTASQLVNSPGASGSQGGSTANFLASSVMFILWFRTGENYNDQTGLMQFDTASDFYNGAYGVTEVTNSFKQGIFTQTLSAYKDPMAQIATSMIVANNPSTQLATANPTTNFATYNP